MFRRLWQWLKQLVQGLFGGQSEAQPSPTSPQEPKPPIDREFLFRQLLEGVAHGWQPDRILRFFEDLDDRITLAQWQDWLHQFGERVLQSKSPNQELATRLVRLGEQTKSHSLPPALRELGAIAYNIGRQLIIREQRARAQANQTSTASETSAQIWEYAGPDAQPTSPPEPEHPTPPLTPPTEEVSPTSVEVESETACPIWEYVGPDAQPISAAEGEGEVDTLLNRGIEYYNTGDFAEALASYDKAIELQGDNSSLWNHRGNVLRNLGRTQEALASYDRAIELQGDNSLAWNNRGCVLQNLARPHDALANYERALELQPDFVLAQENRNTIIADLRGLDELATKPAISSPEVPPSNRQLAQYEQALQLQPDTVEAWSDRAMILTELGRYQEALTSYDKAIELQPDCYPAWNNRGNVLRNLGRYQEALESYDKTIELQADFYQAWNNRGSVLENLGRYRDALLSYDRALQIKPDFDLALANRRNAEVM